jgi:SAM-dependent methyltransferase
MLDAVEVGHGARLLDAGCGAAGASILAARRGARVYGLDASEALIAIARTRVPDAEFCVGDLEELPYGDRAFDIVLAALSVQYAADPLAALRELKRVCAREGRLVISTWGLPELCQQRFVFEAVRSSLPSPPPTAGPFALSAAGALEGLVEQAGWEVVDGSEVECPFVYASFEAHWQAQRSAGPLQAAIRAVGEIPLRAAVERAVQPYRTAAGGVRLENRFRYVTAIPTRDLIRS